MRMEVKAVIADITCYLPKKIESNEDARLREKTGILRRHIAEKEELSSDMAVKAVENLFAKGCNRSDIDYLLYCTQSPDYILPTTACILQDRVGLNKSCGAIDYNLGCSGYIYGLSLAKGLIETKQAKKILLVTAETYSKYINESDQAVRPLFGDAATATLIEGKLSEKEGMEGFIFGTDGSGFEDLIVPVGGMRKRYQDTKQEERVDKQGNKRSNLNLHMNGFNIMQFAMKVVPKTVEEILAKTKNKKEDIDYYVFHQANKFMLEYLQKQCGLENRPYWNDVSEYGNTVSNSIPLALADIMKNNEEPLEKVMLVGFGVGLSWSGCLVNLGNIKENSINEK